MTDEWRHILDRNHIFIDIDEIIGGHLCDRWAAPVDSLPHLLTHGKIERIGRHKLTEGYYASRVDVGGPTAYAFHVEVDHGLEASLFMDVVLTCPASPSRFGTVRSSWEVASKTWGIEDLIGPEVPPVGPVESDLDKLIIIPGGFVNLDEDSRCAISVAVFEALVAYKITKESRWRV